jgi:arginyl-tRNA synthetase
LSVSEALRGVLTGPLGISSDDPLLDEALLLETPRADAHGDLSSVAALRLAKTLRKSPRETGKMIIEELGKSRALDHVFEKTELAGPGFINFTFRRSWVEKEAARAGCEPDLGVLPARITHTIVVDFSAPNVAKPLHVGHIRSTILGDSLTRLLRLLGHTVIADNHLGDWGTQFGMVIRGVKAGGLAGAADSLTLDDVESIYRDVSERAEKDEREAEAARAEVVKLHSGDEENLRIWKALMKTSREGLDATYKRLGVVFDETLGESFYNEQLSGVTGELMQRGIARESEGAVAVFYEADRYPPFLLRKSDGAYLYAATDLATVKHRVRNWNADWIIYVVDARQQLHFEQLFDACRRWGYGSVRFEHASFGSILGEDGRPFRTRAGGTVRLSELLDEAESRAMSVVETKNPELPAGKKREIARTVGIGALKYADLSQNRSSDYVFSWEKMLSLTGNTAPYMQYMYARVRSIFRRGGLDAESVGASGEAYRLATTEELNLARTLVGFPDVVETAASQLRPNFLSSYLYDLAGRFSAFYDNCPVLKASDAELMKSRLMLCDHTARVIRLGLGLLGIDVVEQM